MAPPAEPTTPEVMSCPTDFLQQVAAAREGHESALNALFDRFYPMVRDMVHRALAADLRLKRPWIAPMFSTGDVVQEVFMSVLRDLESFAGTSEGAFVNYLASVTKNRLIDAVRFHEAVRRDCRRVGSVHDLELPQRERDPADHAVTAEEVARFCSVLTSFPTRERLLLRERIERNTTYAELAEELAYPSADSARKAFYAAQARLLMRLGES